LDGRSPVKIETDAHRWGDFRWLAGGRVLFSSAARNAPDGDMNLWELRVNPQSGSPRGAPRQITDWSGFRIESLSLSNDGARLAFDQLKQQTDVFVGQLRGGTLAEPPRRFTLNDYDDFPFFWSPDSKSIFFSSNRLGYFELRKQNLDEDQSQQILNSTDQIDPIRLSPDGLSLLYVDHQGGKMQLMTAPVAGGIGRPYGYPRDVWNVSCAEKPATNCLIADYDPARKRMGFLSFDPPEPHFRRVFEIEPDFGQDVNWTVSPSGVEVAITESYTENAAIKVYSINGSLEYEAKVKGYNRLTAIDWAPDGHSWFVSADTPTGCALAHVYHDGNYRVLWNMRGRRMRTWGIPSPNGKSLAFLGWTINRNSWMIDDLQRAR
jgi:WD40 repeat protein